MLKTIEEIRVFPIDMEKLNDSLSLNTYQTRGKFAIIKNPPTLLDTDCVGLTKLPFEILLYKKDSKNENGQIIFSLFPDSIIQVTLQELEEFIKEEISLVEFLGNRLNYNSRIKNNQDVILKYVNEERK